MSLLRTLSLTALLSCLLSLPSWAGDDPVNAACPVMYGKPSKASISTKYEGKTIGFCCGKCKKMFDADPKNYVAGIPELKAAAGPEIGKKVDFVLKDGEGKEVKLSDFKEKIVVLEWLNPKCAACVRSAKTGLITKLAAGLKAVSEDIVYLPVTCTEGVDAAAFAKWLKDNKIETPGLMDTDGATAKSFGATTTPQCFVIDKEGTLRYAGAMDDDADGKKGAKAVNYVILAANALIAGDKIATETVKPYGTEIKLKK